MRIKDILQKAKITPDPLKDQFFLEDKDIIKNIVGFADLDKSDVVLEIGAGIGNLTKELVKKAGKVIAIEIDERFKSLLSDFPRNVELHFGDAHKIAKQEGKFKKKKEWNKVVSNLPYSLCEWLLHNLTFVEFDKVILLVPQKFAYSAKTNPVFSSFFEIKQLMMVDKDKFYPEPRTNSVVIDLERHPDPIKKPDLPLFLRQYMYQHEEQKVKNSLMEGIIKFALLVYKKQLNKNEARHIVDESDISNDLLEKQPDNPEIYEEVKEKLKEVSL